MKSRASRSLASPSGQQESALMLPLSGFSSRHPHERTPMFRPTLRQILSITTVCGLLTSCDTAKPVQDAGTSSETHSSLQAFADSLALARVPEDSTAIAGRMKMYGNPDVPIPGYDAYYSTLSDGSRFAAQIIVRETVFPEIERTVFRSGPDCMIQDTQLVVQGIGRPKAFHGNGLTRAGFRFSWRMLDSAEYPGYGQNVHVGLNPALVYEFGKRWKVIVPSMELAKWFDSLKVFGDQGYRQIGWLVRSDYVWVRPINDWSKFQVVELEGGTIHPGKLPTTTGWPADSLGIFPTGMKWAPDGSTLLLPFHWNLLPGTAANVALSQETNCRVKLRRGPAMPQLSVQDSIIAVPFRLAADSGSDTVRIHNAKSALDSGMAVVQWPSDCFSRDSTYLRRIYFTTPRMIIPSSSP